MSTCPEQGSRGVNSGLPARPELGAIVHFRLTFTLDEQMEIMNDVG